MAPKTDFFTPPLYYTLPTSHKGKFFLQKKDGSPLRENHLAELASKRGAALVDSLPHFFQAHPRMNREGKTALRNGWLICSLVSIQNNHRNLSGLCPPLSSSQLHKQGVFTRHHATKLALASCSIIEHRFKEISRRSRYYQSVADASTTPIEARYQNLSEDILIFICTFDPFDKDFP